MGYVSDIPLVLPGKRGPPVSGSKNATVPEQLPNHILQTFGQTSPNPFQTKAS